jgi:hypothetical protein
MAGEGLFFTGTVLKNNRNLLSEENSRQQLAMQQEQLEIQKQGAADKRKAQRQEGFKKSQSSYDLSSIQDPKLRLALANKVKELNKFSGDNWDNDDPEVQSQIQDMRSNITSLAQYASQVDTKMQLYNPLNEESNNLRYNQNEDGSRIIDSNYDAIISEMESGTFDLNSRSASFKNDFDGQIKKEDTIPAYKAFFTENQGDFLGSDNNTYHGLLPGSKEEFLNDFKNDHVINASTNDFKSTQAEKTYTSGETFEIDGHYYTGLEAYLLEVEGQRNVDSIKESELARFIPGSESFNEEDHNKYVDYLGGKIWDRESKGIKSRLTQRAEPTKEEKDKITQEDIDLYTGPSKANINYGDVEFKFDNNLYQDVTGSNIKVSLTPETLIEGQGQLQETFNDEYISDVKEDNRPVEGKVLWVGITSDNRPVATVKYGSGQYLIPLATISGKKFKAGSTAYKLYQLASQDVTKGESTTANPAPR